MKAYYAHCVAIYGTPQETRDLDTLKALGFEVINPNCPKVQVEVEMLKRREAADKAAGLIFVTSIMDYFRQFVLDCDVLVFRALPDGRIPSGVAAEIGYAKEYGKPVIELPSNVIGRSIGLEETREYLHEVGNR